VSCYNCALTVSCLPVFHCNNQLSVLLLGVVIYISASNWNTYCFKTGRNWTKPLNHSGRFIVRNHKCGSILSLLCLVQPTLSSCVLFSRPISPADQKRLREVPLCLLFTVFKSLSWVRFNVPPNTYRSYRGRVFTGQMTQPTVSKHWRRIGKCSSDNLSSYLQTNIIAQMLSIEGQGV